MKKSFLLIPDRRYSPRADWQIRRNSGVDSKVWMGKGKVLGNYCVISICHVYFRTLWLLKSDYFLTAIIFASSEVTYG